MKPKKLLLTALTVLCMTILLCTSAFAVDLDDPRFAGKTWDEVMADFLAQKNIDPSQVTVGYYNTVTGEEHYLNPDQLMFGASVAKLPANMLFAERVSKGEMTMDSFVRGSRYEFLQQQSLIKSDNPAMSALVTELGGGNYARFRKTILPYIGETEETVDDAFLARNLFTPTQIIYTLKLLYGNEERFPGVEECLLQASPYDFFKGNQPPYQIAHKYGWYYWRGTSYINDCGIIYTDDPFLLVMFTGNVEDAAFVLADFCSYMIDYTQYQRVQRYANDVYERVDLQLPATLEFLGAESPDEAPDGYAMWQFILLGAGCVMLLATLILAFMKKPAALLTLLLTAMLAGIGLAPTLLAHRAVREGQAQQVISDFSEAFRTNTRGIELLTDCDSAMAHSEGTDLASVITKKISDSFTLTPTAAVRTGNSIALDVTATKVDIAALSEAMQTEWERTFDASLTAADPAVMYDAEGKFDPTLFDGAQAQAIENVLSSWDSFLYTEEATLHLTMTLDGFTPTWKIVCSEALLDLVNYE